MANNSNVFERRRDLTVTRIEQRREVVNQAFGVGQRPYGQTKLAPSQQRQFWLDLPDQAPAGQRSKMTEWQQATPEQQQQIRQWESERAGDGRIGA